MLKWSSVFSMVGLSVLVAFTACSKKDDKSEQVEVKSFKVLGDPNALVKNASVSPESPILETEFSKWKGTKLLSLIQFYEKAEILKTKKDTTKADLEKNNAPTEDYPDITSFQVSLVQVDSQTWKMGILNEMLFLVFEKQGTQMQLVKLESPKGKVLQVSVIHWSLSEDKKYSSVLLNANTEDKGKVILAFYFKMNDDVKETPMASKEFFYITGKGRMVGWQGHEEKPLEIGLCGSTEFSSVANMSVNRWKTVLKDRLNIDIVNPKIWKPFSDLEQRCIQFIDAYFATADENSSTLGITFSPIDKPAAKIVDSDIFMFKSEFDKQIKYYVEKGTDPEIARLHVYAKLPFALTHEIGHMLGLDHQFTGVESVMSYDFKSPELSNYDIRAVQNLYPLKKQQPVKEDKGIKVEPVSPEKLGELKKGREEKLKSSEG